MRRPRQLTIVPVLAVAGALALLAGPAAAQSLAKAAAAPSSGVQTPASLEDRAGLSAFLDGVVSADMSSSKTAGVTVAIVKDGRLLFSRGYGHADVARGTPVDPATTMFRIASITKAFTWTAVMQLVEQGKIDLNADVNQYLDFHIPATYPQPITMKDLMTHTAGFEDRTFGAEAASARELLPLRDYLKTHMPARVRPPGQLPAYSNYGAGLAGYIVQRVSGMSYEDYVQRHILDPLGLTRTTTFQPLPASLRSDASQGYAFADGALASQPFELFNDAPDGSMSSTADDMARFMTAYLQDGRYGGVRILGAQTAKTMQRVLFSPNPRVDGWLYGFQQMDRNGVRVYGHGGDTAYFHSIMALLPDQHVGVFIASNSEGNGEIPLPYDVFTAFMDRYYPSGEKEPTPIAGAVGDAARYAGPYQTTRRSYTTAEKVNGLLSATRISATADGSLIVNNRRYVEVAPALYARIDGNGKSSNLLFRAPPGGKPTVAFANGGSLERLRWYETPRFNLALLVLSLLVLATAPLVSLAAFIARRAYHDATRRPRLAVAARWLQVALFFTLLAFLVGASIVYGDAGWLTGRLSVFWIVGGLSIVLAVMAAGSVVLTAVAWTRGFWRLPGRMHHTVVTLAAVALVWFLSFWNLLGWRY